MKMNCEARFQPDPDEPRNIRNFIGHLECLAGLSEETGEEDEERRKDNQSSEGRAALARLRRTLGKDPDQAIRAYPYVVCWTQNLNDLFDNGEINKPRYEWQVSCYHLIASLFAFYSKRRSWHHAENPMKERRNLGASFRLLGEELSGKPGNDDRSKSVERRFTALLMSRRADLPKRLRYAIALLKAEEIPVDWVQLMEDLKWWDEDNSRRSSSSPTPSVQRRWANSFWRVASAFGSGKEAADDAQDNPQSTKDEEEDQ
jgi:CRISPR system Cascade subunit CasB